VPAVATLAAAKVITRADIAAMSEARDSRERDSTNMPPIPLGRVDGPDLGSRI